MSALALPGFPRLTRKETTRVSTSTIAGALAAGVLGDPNKVRYVALTAQNRFTALQSGEIDVLYRNSTETLSARRDTRPAARAGQLL